MCAGLDGLASSAGHTLLKLSTSTVSACEARSTAICMLTVGRCIHIFWISGTRFLVNPAAPCWQAIPICCPQWELYEQKTVTLMKQRPSIYAHAPDMNIKALSTCSVLRTVQMFLTLGMTPHSARVAKSPYPNELNWAQQTWELELAVRYRKKQAQYRHSLASRSKLLHKLMRCGRPQDFQNTRKSWANELLYIMQHVTTRHPSCEPILVLLPLLVVRVLGHTTTWSTMHQGTSHYPHCPISACPSKH